MARANGANGNGITLALLALWVALSFFTPDAAFLAFPLFFVELHLLPAPVAVPLVVITFGLSVWGTATHLGFEVGSILGPLISSGVAIVIGLGYRAMAQETRDRQALILDLLATREELAAALATVSGVSHTRSSIVPYSGLGRMSQ